MDSKISEKDNTDGYYGQHKIMFKHATSSFTFMRIFRIWDIRTSSPNFRGKTHHPSLPFLELMTKNMGYVVSTDQNINNVHTFKTHWVVDTDKLAH